MSTDPTTDSTPEQGSTTFTYPFHSLLYQFLQSTSEDIDLYARRKINLFFPKVSKDVIIELCHEVEYILQMEPSLIDTTSPCVIIGDIHGHVLDLYRILKYFGTPNEKNINNKFKVDGIRFDKVLPENTKYIFLGDLIDRGEFSVETIIIVFLLKIIFPTNVYIIRGNHEFDYLAKQCGFYSQVSSSFNEYNSLSKSQNTFTEKLMTLKRDSPGSEVYQAFLDAFSYLPFGVRIDGKMLCIHGGIGPKVFNTDSIASIVRPIKDFGVNDIVDSILWSDPKPDDNKSATQKSNNVIIEASTFSEPTVEPLNSVSNNYQQKEFDRNLYFVPSNRGSGFLYGYSALDHFLKASNLDVLVRAHECVLEGCEEVFDGRLITVFSASNYCGFVRNFSAVLYVKGQDDQNKLKSIFERCEVMRFYPLEYLKRPQPITINISSNISDNNNNNQSSSRVIELSGYYRRYSSDVTKKTPLSQLLQTPLKNTSQSSSIQSSRNDADEGPNVLLHDPHKLAGLKSGAPRPSFVRHDVSKFRQNQLLNKLKRNQTHQVELPAFSMPTQLKQQGSQRDIVAASQAPNQTCKRISPAAISATSMLKNRPNSEFKP